MKKMFKLLAVAALMLAAVMMFTACDRGGNEPDPTPQPTPAATPTPGPTTPETTPEPTPEREVVTLRYSVPNPVRTPETHAVDALLAALYEHGFIIEFVGFESDAYQIMIATLETDLIAATRWDGFFDLAPQGAFAPITREQIQTYMPVWYSENAQFLPAATVDGQIFAIPNNAVGINAPYLMYRTDWLPPGMDSINSMEDLYDYLAHALEMYPHIIPWSMSQGMTPWQTPAMAFAYTHLMAPGAPRSPSVLVLDKRDYPNFVLTRTVENEGYREFFRIMRRFHESGFTHADSLVNPFAQNEEFWHGNTAVFNAAPHAWTNWINEQMTALWDGEVEIAVFDFGAVHNVGADRTSAMGRGIAIPFRSADSVPDVLRLIETLYTHEYLYVLWRYGVEGVDFNELEGGVIERLDEEGRDLPAAWGPIYENVRFQRPGANEWPGFRSFMDSIEAREFINPFVDILWDMGTNDLGLMRNSMTSIGQEEIPMLGLGLHADVDTAMDNWLQRQIEAGLEEYEQEVLRQLQEYLITTGQTHVTVRLP